MMVIFEAAPSQCHMGTANLGNLLVWLTQVALAANLEHIPQTKLS